MAPLRYDQLNQVESCRGRPAQCLSWRGIDDDHEYRNADEEKNDLVHVVDIIDILKSKD